MKKITTFLPFLFFLNLLGAMNQNVHLSGVLEDHTGTGISNAAITIEASNGWMAYSNTVYTDNFGNYSDTIVLPDTMDFAELFITTAACNTIALLTEYRVWEPIPASDYVALNCPSPSPCQVEAVLNNSILLIEAHGSGGTPPYSFLWNTGETTLNISPPSSGWYSVTLTDSEGCTTADNIFVYHPNYCDVDIVYTQNDMLNANTVFGNGPINYLWSTGETTTSILPSVADSYIVTITASDGCMSSDTIFFDPDLVDSCSVSIDVYQDGDMLHAAAIGIEPFLYNWNTGSISSSVWPDSIGDYCVTVTDFTGCTTTACHTVDYLCNLGVWLDFDDSLFTILPVITEGTPPFTYNWSTGETTESIQPTMTGGYYVTITDAYDCTAVGWIYHHAYDYCGVSLYLSEDTILQTTDVYGADPITYSWSTGETTTSIAPTEAGYYSVTINASDGCVNGDTIYYDPDLLDSCSVSIAAYQGGNVLSASASGAAPFTYSWNTGSSSNYIWPDSNGVYCVTVTDNYSCSSTACYTVTNMCDLNFWLSINDSLYIIEPVITGGTPPLTYNWSTGETTPSIQPAVTGWYTLTITDAFGCIDGYSQFFDYSDYCGVGVYLTEDTLLQTTNLYGEAPFTYAWNTGETTSSIAPTEVGFYSVTINASDGCTIADTIYYDPDWIDSCGVTLTLSPNGNYLSATAGGVAPFTYSWNPGSTNSNLWLYSNGVYCVTVIDSYGCTATACQTVTHICNMVVDITANDSIALLESNITTPGNAPYVYNWSTGETTASIIPDTSGVYFLTVTDAYGCSDTDAFYFNLNNYCDVDIEVSSDDNLNASAYGADPLTYLWNTGETGTSIDPPNAGWYTVTISASDGCVSADTIFYDPGLIDSCSITLQMTQAGQCLQAIGNGVNPLSYNWSNGQTTSSICPGANGQYCVTVTDNMGCTAFTCGDITAYLDTCYVAIIDSFPGELMAVGYGTNDTVSYTWSNGATTPTIIPTTDGTYCVTLTDTEGCVAVDCIDFYISNTCQVDIYNWNNGSLNAYAYGLDTMTFIWNTGETTSGIFPTTNGEYCVTVTASNGCTATDCTNYSVMPSDSCQTTIWHVQNATCLQSAFVAGGTPPFTYIWDTGDSTSLICPTANGTYCVTITDNNGCSASDCEFFFTGTDSCEVVIVDSIAGELMALPSGSVSNSYSFLWSTGDTLPSITNVIPNQTYCVTITNNFGCEASDCFTTNFNGPSISGYVSLENMPSANIDEAIVQLFEYNQGAGSMDMIASTPLVDGNFAFTDIPVGDYLLRAMLGEADLNTDAFLPTYNNHELWWNDVTAITVNEAVTNQQILLIAAEPLGSGTGNISGGVEEGENIRGDDDDRNAGEPIAEVSIILLNAEELPVAYAMTDADGAYSFENLPWGTYKVVLEIAGIEQPAYWVTLSPEMPSVDDQDFIVDEDSAATTVSTSSIVMAHSISLFPNPTRTEIYLNFELSQATILTIDLVNVNGQTVLNRRLQLGAGQYTETFDLNALPAGVYQLQMVDAKGTTSRKIVKY